jgi:hypothetical protein
MRLTVNLDEDLHRVARSFALAEQISISAAINRLLRRGIAPDVLPGVPSENARTILKGRRRFPVSRCARAFTEDEITRAIEGEDLRSQAGWGEEK